MSCDVAVVGGGISGLAAAWRCQAAGRRVELFEAGAEPGGNIRTTSWQGFRVERGPHSFAGSADDVFSLADEVGVGAEVVPANAAAGHRYILRRGRLHRVPEGPGSFLATGLLSPWAKLVLATEPLRTRRGDAADSARAFFERRFGREAAGILAGAFVNGVYAGDLDSLSAAAAFPLFWRFEQESGGMIRGFMRHAKERRAAREALGAAAPPRRSGLFAMRQGLGQLTQAVAARLGERCHLQAPVRAIRRQGGAYEIEIDGATVRAGQVVLATPPGAAAALLGPVDPVLGEQLQAIPMAPVAVVHSGYGQRLDRLPDAFGFLAPRDHGARVLGVLYPSRIFDGRAPQPGDLLTAFVGGVRDPAALSLSDAELSRLVQDDLRTLARIEDAPEATLVVRHPAAIPQLVAGHLGRIDEVRARLAALPGLHLAGNYLFGVGMKDAVRSGLEAARAVLATPAGAAAARPAPEARPEAPS